MALHFRQNDSATRKGTSSRESSFSLWQPSLPPTFDSWWADLSPEFRLMLACLRLTPSEKEIRQIANLSRSGINWNNLLILVDRHRTAPLVYWNLRRYGNNLPASRYGLRCSPVLKAILAAVLPMPLSWCGCTNFSRKTTFPSFPSRAVSWPHRFTAIWPCAMPGILTCWWRPSMLSSPTNFCELVIAVSSQVFRPDSFSAPAVYQTYAPLRILA